MQPATQIPAGTSKAMKQRLDQYLQEICSLMRDVDPDRIRERIVELAAVYHASVWDYENSSTIAERRKRVRSMLSTMGRVIEDAQPIFDTLGEMTKDDGDFCRGGFGETI